MTEKIRSYQQHQYFFTREERIRTIFKTKKVNSIPVEIEYPVKPIDKNYNCGYNIGSVLDFKV